MASPQQLAARIAIIPAAQSAMKSSGVPASITIAQWELESTWGTSQLAVKALNFFGIKAEHLNDPNTYMEFPTFEYENGKKVLIEADFEKYPDLVSSFADHARLLSQASRYAPAMAVRSNACAFGYELQKCGYSTSPTYGKSLCQIVTGSNLTQYDVLS